MVTSKTPGDGRDILAASANNLYDGVTMADLDGFKERYGLNSRLVKDERRGWSKRSGASTAATAGRSRRIVGHLQAALPYAPPAMRRALEALIRFYETGEDADRVAYDIAWVEDKDVARRHDQRLHRELPGRARRQRRVGSARVLREPREDREPAAAGRSGGVVRSHACRGIRSGAGPTWSASPRARSTSSSRPAKPGRRRAIGINLPNDQRIREMLRQQVRVARQHQRGVREVAAAGVPARVLLVGGGSGARGEVGRASRARRRRRFTRCSATDRAASPNIWTASRSSR